MRRLVRLVLGGGHHRGLATSAGRGAESKRPRREPSPGTSRPRVPRTNDPAPDFTSLENMLNWEAERVVKLLGLEPNEKLSRPGQVRVGTKGALSVLTVQREVRGLLLRPGTWHNFETDESGGMLALVGKVKGLEGLPLYRFAVNKLLPQLQRFPPTPPPVELPVARGMDGLAAKILAESGPILGSPAERYLASRGLTHFDSPSLLFHNSLRAKDADGEWRTHIPGLVVVASNPKSHRKNIQVTYLDRATARKDTELPLTKRTYGSFQDPLGFHAVLLGAGDRPSSFPDNPTFIAEGVETGLSVLQAFPGDLVMATLGKSNLARIDPDTLTDRVILVLDNDGPHYSKDRLVGRATRRLLEAGKRVYTVWPAARPGRDKTDMNDVLQQKGEEGVHSTVIDTMKKIVL